MTTRFRWMGPVLVNTDGKESRGTAIARDSERGLLVVFEDGTQRWIPDWRTHPVETGD